MTKDKYLSKVKMKMKNEIITKISKKKTEGEKLKNREK